MTATEAYPDETTTRTVQRDASVGELLSEVTDDLSTLMRQQIDLAKAEIKEEAVKAGKGAGMLGGAAFAGYMVLVVGTFAAVFGIAALLGLGWAALIMTGVWAVIAAVLGLRGRTQLRNVSPKPDRTVQTLKEDAQWARHPTS